MGCTHKHFTSKYEIIKVTFSLRQADAKSQEHGKFYHDDDGEVWKAFTFLGYD